jgi:DNA-binding MarR family transcriptional regulator
MNPFGNVMMASGVLRGFGLDEAQMKKATDVFLDIPNGVSAQVPMTLRQYAALEAIAAKQGKTVGDLIREAAEKAGK